MNNIELKVVGWDEKNLLLSVKFNHSESNVNIDDTQISQYNPFAISENNNDLNQVIKQIACHGLDVCEHRVFLEQARLEQDKIKFFKNLVGQTFSYSVSDLKEDSSFYGIVGHGDELIQFDQPLIMKTL
jgi:hypothetical protein